MIRLTDEQRDRAAEHYRLIFWAQKKAGFIDDDQSYDAAVDSLLNASVKFNGQGKFSGYAGRYLLWKVKQAGFDKIKARKRMRRVMLVRLRLHREYRDRQRNERIEFVNMVRQMHEHIDTYGRSDRRCSQRKRLLYAAFNVEPCTHQCTPFVFTGHFTERWEQRIDKFACPFPAYRRAVHLRTREGGEVHLWDKETDAVFFVQPVYGGWSISTTVPKHVYDRDWLRQGRYYTTQ